MKKYDEKFFLNLFVIVITAFLYMLAINSLLSFIFWPNDALNFLDYIIEILAYALIATFLLYKRKQLVNILLK